MPKSFMIYLNLIGVRWKPLSVLIYVFNATQNVHINTFSLAKYLQQFFKTIRHIQYYQCTLLQYKTALQFTGCALHKNSFICYTMKISMTC